MTNTLYSRVALIFIVLATMVLAFSGCSKDEIELEGIGTSVVRGQDITGAAFYGTAKDDAGAIVGGAIVRLDTRFDTADANGAWRIDFVELTEPEAYITVESPQHLLGSRTVIDVEADGQYNVDITLLPKAIAGRCNGGADCNISFGGDGGLDVSTVSFPMGAFETASGPYQGTVEVVAHYLDGVSEQALAEMPGDLRGVNTDGETLALRSFGMVAIELQTTDGEEVWLRDGIEADLSIPIEPSILADAPAQIPMWYFDDAVGRWQEEGIGNLDGDRYTASVTHFTFWNWDVAFQPVLLSGGVLSTDGVPIARASVEIESQTQGTRTQRTDARGIYSGYVPTNEALTIRIIDECNTPVWDTVLNPLAVDLDLGFVSVQSQTTSLSLSGISYACGDTTMGVPANIEIRQGPTTLARVFSDEDGYFEVMVTACATEPVQFVATHLVDSLVFGYVATIDPTIGSDSLAFEMCEEFTEVDALILELGPDTYSEIDPVAKQELQSLDVYTGTDPALSPLQATITYNSLADTLVTGYYIIGDQTAEGTVQLSVRNGATEYTSYSGVLQLSVPPVDSARGASFEFSFAGQLSFPDGSKSQANVRGKGLTVD